MLRSCLVTEDELRTRYLHIVRSLSLDSDVRERLIAIADDPQCDLTSVVSAFSHIAPLPFDLLHRLFSLKDPRARSQGFDGADASAESKENDDAALASVVVRKPRRRRRLSKKQKATSLFRLWHSIQEMKTEAETMRDRELVLLVAMVEVLIEERTTSLSIRDSESAAATVAKPN
jgi:hypothetical protein